MGYFSWMLANKNNEQALMIGDVGYVIQPEGMGKPIKTEFYEGYGRFDGKDVYELVVDWNRPYLSSIIRNISRKGEDYNTFCLIADKAVNGDDKADSLAQQLLENGEISELVRTNWKRNLGIKIACCDEDNEALPYPIKISSSSRFKYNNLIPSKNDPNQGL